MAGLEISFKCGLNPAQPDKFVANSVFPRQAAQPQPQVQLVEQKDEKEEKQHVANANQGAPIALTAGEVLGTIRNINAQVKRGLINLDGPEQKLCSFYFTYVCSEESVFATFTSHLISYLPCMYSVVKPATLTEDANKLQQLVGKRVIVRLAANQGPHCAFAKEVRLAPAAPQVMPVQPPAVPAVPAVPVVPVVPVVPLVPVPAAGEIGGSIVKLDMATKRGTIALDEPNNTKPCSFFLSYERLCLSISAYNFPLTAWSIFTCLPQCCTCGYHHLRMCGSSCPGAARTAREEHQSPSRLC